MTTGRKTPARVGRAGRQIGEHLQTWRKLQHLTAEQVAERAGVSRGTLRRLENGELGVSLEVVLRVTRALGQLEALTDSVDPYESELGRLRADATLPKRVRHARPTR